jgi:hypothetical protein
MANDFKDESPTVPTGAQSWSADITYCTELFTRSLSFFDAFYAELHQHVNLLYGGAMTDRLNALGIHERNKRLLWHPITIK